MGRTTSFIQLYVFFAVVFLVLQVYVAFAFRRWVRASFPEGRQERWRRAGLWFLAAGNVLFLGSFSMRWLPVYASASWKILNLNSAELYVATIMTAAVLALAADVVRCLRFWFLRGKALLRRIGEGESTSVEGPPETAVSEGRRRVLRLGGYAAMGAAVGTPVLLTLTTPRNYRFHRRTLWLPGLPAPWDGMTVSHLSDLHSGVYMSQEHLREVFTLTQEYGADMIVMTGDYIDASDTEIEPLEAELGILKADLGVWACLGNHDHFGTAGNVTAALQRHGVAVLRNRTQTLVIEGQKLALMGIDDYGFGSRNFARPDEAFRNADAESFRLLLAHRPEFFPEAKARGVHLQLSGHTHGGQVGIDLGPVKLNPAYLMHTYVAGVYGEGHQQLFVNVGVGMVGAPIRLVPPEIVLLTLRRG